MQLSRLLILPATRPSLTVRWRLTLLYSLLFVICAFVLLSITYKLFADFAFTPPKPGIGPAGQPSPTSSPVASAMSVQRAIGLHRLKLYSGIALAFTGLLSVALGWLVAGHVLAPLRTITATAERITATNLHERLAMGGPRDELRRLADTIDQLLERLEAAFEAQRQFVANASHELRTPLAVMRTTLDVAVAKPGGVPAQTRELDADLRVDLDHADALLEGFLTLARAQSHQLGETESVELRPLVTAALEARSGRISAARLTVTANLVGVQVAGNAILLRRMIDNVIENAVRHNQPRGSIVIDLSASDPRWARMIVDTSGHVLSEQSVTELAQPFRRLREDRTGSENGHGIGLSIVAAVAAAHDGRLDLRARPEGGLRVQISLPASEPVPAAEAGA